MNKCKLCGFRTYNRSRLCDVCLQKKYNLRDERCYKESDYTRIQPLIPLSTVLKILDEIETCQNK
ncbi:MAG: hypothetical protein ACOC56_02900 [Atribacterota bacterium]